MRYVVVVYHTSAAYESGGKKNITLNARKIKRNKNDIHIYIYITIYVRVEADDEEKKIMIIIIILYNAPAI